MMRLARNFDPLEPAAISFRRKAAIEYLGQAIFIDREHGARVATKVLDTTPMSQTAIEAGKIKIEKSKLPQPRQLK
jgi:TetR/AcrR family transcriptional regulator